MPGSPAAATAGVGGGNFASSMANINFFFPSKAKGAALGLNAAGGNAGVAVIQFFLPIIVGGAGAFGLVKASKADPPGARRLPVRRPGGRRRCLRVHLHEQPRGREVQAARAARRGEVQAHLGDVVPLHRHLRLVHRLLRRDAAADQDQLLPLADPDGVHRHQLRLLRVPRCARRLHRPSVRRLAGRQVRRRPRHLLDLRRR